MRILLLFVVLLIHTSFACGQNIQYARKIIDTLCSPVMAGRGYLKEGDLKAAEYIQTQFNENGLKAFNGSFFQKFGFPVNVFPSNPTVSIDGEDLIAGTDFLVHPSSRSANGTFELVWVDSATIDNSGRFKKFEDDTHFRRSFLVLDVNIMKGNVLRKERLQKLKENGYKAHGLIELHDKLLWSVSTEQALYPRLQVLKTAMPKGKTIKVDIFSQVNAHSTQNVIGYVRGSVYPDSFIVFTAHYDHLGKMGKDVYFPGANDNASGTAMLLDLSRHFASCNPKSKYSVVFIAFAGEEAGLLGSYYYTQHPLFPLNQIKLLMNLDLMGTGSKGATVVNATEFPQQYNLIEIVNAEKDYLPAIYQRGKAQNSDHYFFSEMGVPAFFMYLMGDYPYYHEPEDKAENLKLEKYENTFLLLCDLVKELER
ncbi:MAG TPA: M28 family peptidase [Bacteroidia bacterium]|nr:M28 family peptidase [Bacteroidia bacterium]